jgi:adenylate cyclase
LPASRQLAHADRQPSERRDKMTTEPERAPLSTEVPSAQNAAGPPAHYPLMYFRLFEQLKQRNVFRVAVLYLVVCWLVLEPVHVIFHMLDVPTWANRLVVMLMAAGFPAAVVFAWVYEVTPEGLKPTVEVPHGQSIRKRTGRRLDRAIIAVLAVALAYFVVDKFWLSKRVASSAVTARSQSPAVPEKSIAVLPFVDLSEKHDQEYFADGMAEEILDILAKVPSLKVVGRTSSFQFKGRNEDLRTIGTRLGVTHVLEGSVRRSADRVRVTAQLIDSRDGTHVWSETYDRPANDALLMQGEIATTLSRSLEIGIGGDRPQSNRRLKNDAAYDLYLRGRYAAERGDADGLATGVTYLRQALDADPSFADAAVALALTYYQQAFTSLEPSGVYELARHAAESALRLNPQLGLAHAVLGGIHNDYDWQWAAADREFKQALALAPHDGRVLAIAADHAVALGQLDAARQMLKQALDYDPLLADAYATLSWTEWCSGRYAEMLAAARKVLEIDPAYDWGHINVGLAFIYLGDPGAAITEIKRESNPMEQAAALALAYHALGQATDSNAALRRLITDGSGNYAYEVAEVYAYRGERDEAFKWLERAYVQKDGTLKWVARDPTMAKLESDPRHKAFLQKMNLPEQ